MRGGNINVNFPYNMYYVGEIGREMSIILIKQDIVLCIQRLILRSVKNSAL